MAQKKIPKRVQFSIWYMVIGFLIIMVLQNLFISQQVERVPYSDFKGALREGRIIRVTLTHELVKGTMRVDGPQGKQERPFVSVRVDDPELVKELEARNIKFSGELESKLITHLFSWVLPGLLLLGVWLYFFRRMGPGTTVMTFGKAKARIYGEKEVGVTLNDVAGVDEAKEELREVVEFLKNPERFRSLGARIPKGVLLVGPPGGGKTLLAKAVAGEAGVPFFSMSGSSFVELFVGTGAARVRDLFAQAQERAPCIIFIDELDALGKARGANPLAGHDEREQTLNQLLVEMDGFDPRKGVIILAATNRPEILDPALLRPGRFDRHVLVDRPDLNGRLAILQVHAKGIKLAENVDLKTIAARTAGFVGADLARATDIARRMVKEYGMSEKLGLVTFEKEKGPFFLPPQPFLGKEYSEDKAREIDAEVDRIIEEAHNRVRSILSEKSETLDKLASRLLEREVVEEEELKAILSS